MGLENPILMLIIALLAFILIIFDLVSFVRAFRIKRFKLPPGNENTRKQVFDELKRYELFHILLYKLQKSLKKEA